MKQIFVRPKYYVLCVFTWYRARPIKSFFFVTKVLLLFDYSWFFLGHCTHRIQSHDIFVPVIVELIHPRLANICSDLLSAVCRLNKMPVNQDVLIITL